MDTAGTPQHLLLVGGTSEIALAVAHRYAGRGLEHVVVAARPSVRRDTAAADLAARGVQVSVLDFDAERPDTVADLAHVLAPADLDLAVFAAGMLDTSEASWRDPRAAQRQVQVNYAGLVAAAAVVADRMVGQGHGVLVALSSVAGERVRRSNFAYGATKAGLDGHFVGLTEVLRPHGVRVVVVRPGFVRTAMTRGLAAAPFAVGPEEVADAVVRAVTDGRELVWVPPVLRVVLSVVRHLPRPVFRRLPW